MPILKLQLEARMTLHLHPDRQAEIDRQEAEAEYDRQIRAALDSIWDEVDLEPRSLDEDWPVEEPEPELPLPTPQPGRDADRFWQEMTPVLGLGAWDEGERREQMRARREAGAGSERGRGRADETGLRPPAMTTDYVGGATTRRKR